MNGTSDAASGSLQLIDIGQLAEITGLSRPTLWRHNDAGLIPPGMKIGRAVRWRLADVEHWIECGCPPVHVEGRQSPPP